MGWWSDIFARFNSNRASSIGTAPPRALIESSSPVTGGSPKFTEFGSLGLETDGYNLVDELDPRVRGQKKALKFAEMIDNSAGIGAAYTLILSLLTQAEVSFEIPEDGDEETIALANFYNTLLHDMETPWTTVCMELYSAPFYGFAVSEMLFKRRMGPNKDPLLNSKYSDGLIGLRDMRPRDQTSIEEWMIQNGKAVGFWQRIASHGGRYAVPLDKCLHLALFGNKRNPEGRSIIRSALRAYQFRCPLEEREAIGIDRGLAGLPTAQVPPKMLDDGASAQEQAIVTYLRQVLSDVRYDSSEGLIIPGEIDEMGDPTGIKVYTMSSSHDPSKAHQTIMRHRTDEVVAPLCEFLLLGVSGHGSHSLQDSKTSTLATALGAVAKIFTDAIDTQLTPLIAELNNFPQDKLPKAKHSDIEKIDLTAASAWLGALSASGSYTPDDKSENWGRGMIGMPLKPLIAADDAEDMAEDVKDQMED